MDSTSKLFSRLHLTQNSTRAPQEMDVTESELAEGASAATHNPRMRYRRKKNTHNLRGSNPQTFESSSTARKDSNDNKHQLRQAKLAQEINNILETEYSSHAQDDVLETEQNKVSYQNPHKRSWKKKGKEQLPVYNGGDFVLRSREKREKHDASWKNPGHKRFVSSGYNAETSNINRMKGINYPRWSEFSSPKNAMPRNIAQSGYNSRHNMACDDNAPKDYEWWHGEYTDGSSSQIANPNKKKENILLEDNIFCTGQNVEAHSNRSSENIAWRRCDTRTNHSVPSEENNGVSGSSGHLSNRRKNAMECNTYANSEIANSYRLNTRENQRHRKFMGEKRKHGITNYCGSSSLASENSGTPYNQLPRHSPTRSSSIIFQHNNATYAPDMEVDELQLPDSGFNNYLDQNLQVHDNDKVTVSQIESDELLARQLQKQYYDEVAGPTTTEENDATLAWSLQEEDTWPAASIARSDQSNHREESMAHLYAYYTQLPHRNSMARSSNRAQTSNTRRNFYSPELDRETRMMADVRNFAGMDSGMRHDFLEALEAAFDNSNDALHDFNENDYEMLLTLDDNTYQHMGASEDQISSLPQSIMKSDNADETCAICLEKPSIGENIRHLPCLHKFHIECIDTWLRRKACCPVCKSELT